MIKLSEKINLKTLKRVAVLFFITSLLSSCYKSPKQLGAEILPENSKLKIFYSDTTTVFAHSEKIDSVRTDVAAAKENIAGSIKDPVFGITTAGFYTQFLMTSNGHDFGENPVLDSLVLQLRYSKTFGDTNSLVTLHTYEMKEPIYYDTIYYSDFTVPVYGNDYSNYQFKPRPHDSIPVGKDTIKGILRINLTDIYPDLGNKIIGAGQDDLQDNDHFLEYFKGLYVVAEPVTEGGVLMFFDLSSHYSNLTVYYRNAEDDSLKYTFVMSGKTARINHFEHDFSKASQEFQQQVVNGDTTLGDKLLYVQGLGGVKTVLTIPFIRNYAKLGTIGINEAILELPGFDTEPFYQFPDKMALIQRLEGNEVGLLIDQFEGEHYFGGFYNASRNVYEFRITRYIQSLLLDSTAVNNGFYLFVNGGTANPQRFVFNGPHPASDTLNALRLKIVYTDTD
jgi:hypothetical protein